MTKKTKKKWEKKKKTNKIQSHAQPNRLSLFGQSKSLSQFNTGSLENLCRIEPTVQEGLQLNSVLVSTQQGTELVQSVIQSSASAAESLSGIGSKLQEITKIGCILEQGVQSMFQPLVESSVSLNSNIQQIQEGFQCLSPNIDPIIFDSIEAPLKFAFESIGQQGAELAHSLGIVANLTQIPIGFNSQISAVSNTLGLNSLALEKLGESILLERSSQIATQSFSEEDELTERIEAIEAELESAKKERSHRRLTILSEKVESLLRDVCPQLADKFNAIQKVIFDEENKDRVAQSSESMTRILEKLPRKLTKVDKGNQSKLLAKYFGNKDHPLIKKQSVFYETFSLIRHGESKKAKKYLADFRLYQATLIQAEALIYEIISFK